MDTFTEEFRTWMDERRLKAAEVAEAVYVTEQAIRNWRSAGVPPRRKPQLAEWMAEYDRLLNGDPHETLRQRILVLEPTREEHLAWQRAALSEGKIVEDWAVSTLNSRAIERGYGDLLNEKVFPTLKAAEEIVPYQSKKAPDSTEEG